MRFLKCLCYMNFLKKKWNFASPGMLKLVENWFYCIMLFTSLSLFWKMDAIVSFWYDCIILGTKLNLFENSDAIVWLGCIMPWTSLNLLWKMDALIWLDCNHALNKFELGLKNLKEFHRVVLDSFWILFLINRRMNHLDKL